MFRRARHQKGSLQRAKRKSGQSVVIFRWYEIQPDGAKRYRKVVVGTVDELKTESDAQKAVDALRLTINEKTPRQMLKEISFETLVQHYRQHEMPDIFYKRAQLPAEVALEVNVTRSVVKQRITRCKTEASRKPIPLDPELAEVLLTWKLRAPYPHPGDWVFASPHTKGKQPYWPGSLFCAHLKPALKAAGIPGNVGWHTLRHTFGTLMKANGEDMKTIQELLRHSNYKVTADTYTQAVTPTKRAAQTKLVKMILLPAKPVPEEHAPGK
jgi:integrase